MATPLPSTMTLTELFERYAARNLFSQKTVYQYGVQIRHFNRFLGREATIDDLNDDAVIPFLMDRARKTTPATSNKARSHVVALWNFAARKRWAAEFPTVNKLKEPKRLPVAWTPEEIKRLVETAYDGSFISGLMVGHTHIAGISPRYWWTAFLLTLFDTGVRVGALRQLPCDALNHDTGRLFVDAIYQKQLADQVFILHPMTLEVFRQFQHVKRELLLPWPWDHVTFYGHYKALLVAAGLPTGRKCGPHKIRKSVATFAEIFIRRGAGSAILGHSSPNVTVRNYIDPAQLPDCNVGRHFPRPLLIGLESAAGEAPTVEELMPPEPEPITIVQHVVNAVVLPHQPPGESPLLDADPLTLLSAFVTEDFSGVKEWFRRRVATELKAIVLGGDFQTVRSLTAAAVLAWFEAEHKAGRLAKTTADRRIWAAMRFMAWLVRERGLYGLAREVDSLARRSGRKRGRPGCQKGGQR